MSEKELAKDFAEKNIELTSKICELSHHGIHRFNKKSEYYLDKAICHLIMAQNSIWNEYFNHRRIIHNDNMWTIIKKFFGFYKWEKTNE